MTTYVNFAGTCAAAFRFYEQHLGGQIAMMMTHGQAPRVFAALADDFHADEGGFFATRFAQLRDRFGL